MSDRGTNETGGTAADGAAGGAANEAAAEATSDASGTPDTSDTTAASVSGEDGDGSPRELSRVAAVAVTVVAIACGCAALLASFHWLGWTVPGIGWIVAKAGIKLSVGGFVVLAVAADHLRGKLRPKRRS
ncbi:hypothetical protein ACFVXG_18360 [Kitasatospora sp. NPDC058162]|uniref:hypothetical protein n=1 Tax=Kitasatospora sp. NPDC058162 TaxID=3346362 RepID=UPI0036D84C00